MKIENFKKKIEMKNLLQSEIKEEMVNLGEKATEILIKNDEIFNSGTIKPVLLEGSIIFNLECNVDYAVLRELDKELQPDRIVLSGSGTANMFSGQSERHFINIKIVFD